MIRPKTNMPQYQHLKTIAAIVLVYLAAALGVQAQDQPNVLLIIADDLGIDAINNFGVNSSTTAKTPNIDQLRAEGLTYSNAWATPSCTPTRASIMSGKYGIKTNVLRPPGNLDLEHQSLFTYIDSSTTNLYSSAVIGKWHISQPVNLEHPFLHGVDHFEGIINGVIGDYYSWEKVEDGNYVQVDEYITTHLTNSAINWIDNQDQPWIMWLSHIAPHSPFQVPPEDLYTTANPTTDQEIYYASIEALDHEIGRLIESMDEATRSNTLIIFIGDNGTPNVALSGYPNGHSKSSLYEGGLRVPMIISGKGVDRVGEEENGLVQVNDLHATLIETCANPLAGGIRNSYSLRSSFTADNTIDRQYVYADHSENGVRSWAIKTNTYKLIEDEEGNQEFYRIDEGLDELDNLIDSLQGDEAAILADLMTEAETIQTGWSCRDKILNGSEVLIDDCASVTDCDEVDVLSDDNIGCCDSPDEPSVYYEYEEDNQRNIYSNGFPSHDYCYNPNNVPSQSYHYVRLDLTPEVSNMSTSITRTNGRPARHFGIALNGVYFSPAPATPFIYTNKETGEFNWDWVFEPTTNQGDGPDQVKLDCSSAHTNANGYHYHGEMFEYLETIEQGITSTASLEEVLQVGWASDGFPIVYKFGPDQNGVIKELQPSFALKTGERPGDGITAPCGPYTGKYTVDFEYQAGLGDLDECNGIAAEITLNTALGVETFNYYYVVTSTFPQISRCLKGTVSPDFEQAAMPPTGIDNDGDGFLSTFDCDDNDSSINPLAVEIPNNDIDENCDGITLITSTHELSDIKIDIFPNPASDYINIEVESNLKFEATLYDMNGRIVIPHTTSDHLDVRHLPASTYVIQITDRSSGESVKEMVAIRR